MRLRSGSERSLPRVAEVTRRLQAWVRELAARNEDQVFLAITLLIGALVGLVIVAFIVVTDGLEDALYAETSPRWRRLVTPIGATLLVGFLIYRFFPDARGSGVPQTKAALFARGGYISFRTVVGKFFCSSMTLASGIALGREGPSVQISFFVSYRLQRQPIYEALALQEGIHLPTSESSKRHREVRAAMRPPREVLTTEMTVAGCLERTSHSSLRAWPVVDNRGVWGVVSLADLERAVGGRQENKVGSILDTRNFPHLHADHSLDLALERMGSTGTDLLPVVSRANIHEMEGVCSLLDVLRAFGVRDAGNDVTEDSK